MKIRYEKSEKKRWKDVKREKKMWKRKSEEESGGGG